ncbi:MAG: hypothetical protein WC612_07830 [Bdellovibrionales bacterium]|jgi:Flp pilus assembly secretin CpaC
MRSGFFFLPVLLAILLGCTDVDVPKAKSTTGRLPTVAEVPDPEETVRGAEDPPIVTLHLGSRLHERRLSRTEELPANIIVPNTNLNAVPVTSALQAILSGTDVSLSWEAGSFDSRLVTVTNLSGSLPKVVEKVCTSAKVFCSFRNGLLELKEKETFIIDLPTVPTKTSATGAATNTMADTIGELAGDKARIDLQGGNLLYTTDVDGQEQVKEYLYSLRHGRPLVVMQLYIWEVVLNKDRAAGVNWRSFSLEKMGTKAENILLSGTTGFASLASPGVSLGATFSGKVDAESVLQFLSTQGQVQTISNPQLTFVSGSSADFRVGGKQRYISQVGTNSSVAGTTSSTTSSNTVSTDSIDTGLKISVGGSFESSIISASLDLELQDVISLNPTTMENGTTVDLPETSERKVTTSLRVRPGDNLVLAGLVSSRDTNDRDGVPLPFGASLNAYGRDQLKNTELVILVKPSVVVFADSEEEPAATAPAKKTKKTASKPIEQDAIVIDKDGAQTMALPISPSSSSSFDPLPPAKPELMVKEEPLPQPLSQAMAEPVADGAPVDKRLMQRGFSHAFDEMLSPASSPVGAPMSLTGGGL